ncbi:MAG: HAD family phosphatase [Rhizobium pusense]|nr:HAD family phosphatase [Agrobacterium pusense]
MLPFLPRAVVFDMDGLLIESERLYRDSFLAASEEGGHGMRVETYQKVCGSPWDVITGTIFADYGADFPIDSFRDAWLRHLGVMMADGVALKPGVTEILDLLDSLDIRRAIATSSRHDSVTRHLGPHDLLTEPKPAPMPYLTAARRLSLDPGRCLALEDSYSGVRSATSAGMMTIMVPDVAPPTEEMREKCVAVASDLHMVAALLQKAQA